MFRRTLNALIVLFLPPCAASTSLAAVHGRLTAVRVRCLEP